MVIYAKAFPKETLRIILDDVDETWVHINLDDGHIVSVMDKSRRLYRWLFNESIALTFQGSLVKDRFGTFLWSF